MNFHTTPSTKRPRAPSSPSPSLSTSPGSADPPSKASRLLYFPPAAGASDGLGLYSSGNRYGHDGTPAATSSNPSASDGSAGAVVPPHGGAPLLCTLPPTCHHRPTPIANTAELESHYAKYHAHVCAEAGCGCVFPEGRLLTLHQTECHDPLAMIRKERGDKIFQCHIPAPTCGRDFATPKARRLHLIQAHGYPKAYFFAVTNKGIGGLLRRWGEGASMVRGAWKPREVAVTASAHEAHGGGHSSAHRYRDKGEDVMDEDEDEDEHDSDDANGADDDGGAAEDDEEAYEEEDLAATPRMLPRTTGMLPVHSPPSSVGSSNASRATYTTHKHHASAHPQPHATKQKQKQKPDNGNKPSGIDGLADSLSSLSLVPSSIRFGRGGKTSGFAPPPPAYNAHVERNGHAAHTLVPGPVRGARGLGPGRGRGRGRGRGGALGGDVGAIVSAADPATDADSAPQAHASGRGKVRGVPRARARARGGMRGVGRGG